MLLPGAVIKRPLHVTVPVCLTGSCLRVGRVLGDKASKLSESAPWAPAPAGSRLE